MQRAEDEVFGRMARGGEAVGDFDVDDSVGRDGGGGVAEDLLGVADVFDDFVEGNEIGAGDIRGGGEEALFDFEHVEVSEMFAGAGAGFDGEGLPAVFFHEGSEENAHAGTDIHDAARRGSDGADFLPGIHEAMDAFDALAVIGTSRGQGHDPAEFLA